MFMGTGGVKQKKISYFHPSGATISQSVSLLSSLIIKNNLQLIASKKKKKD